MIRPQPRLVMAGSAVFVTRKASAGLPPGVSGRAELVVGVGLDCRIADVCGGVAELGQHGAGRARRLRLCQGVEHLAKVFINPEMTLAVTQDKPCLGQVL